VFYDSQFGFLWDETVYAQAILFVCIFFNFASYRERHWLEKPGKSRPYVFVGQRMAVPVDKCPPPLIVAEGDPPLGLPF
jgi:hypothetical protein